MKTLHRVLLSVVSCFASGVVGACLGWLLAINFIDGGFERFVPIEIGFIIFGGGGFALAWLKTEKKSKPN
jgi:hypothetical protein